jgi:pimeloyl-ACP methyl ester carboxylesterase
MAPSTDEIALIGEAAEELGIAIPPPGAITRETQPLVDGRAVSALRWGPGEPGLVLLHGGAQNAHTWDPVALILGQPLLAVDLPGHGLSSWREDARYEPKSVAEDVVAVADAFAPEARGLVGMSFGGLTALALTAFHPGRFGRAVIVDVTPGVRRDRSGNQQFIYEQLVYDDFEDMLARTSRFRPTRTVSSLRRALVYNARQREDGRWVWRHHFGNRADPPEMDFTDLWGAVDAIDVPLMLVLGSESRVVTDDDLAEFVRRQPSTRVEIVDGASHAVQSDRPTELTALLQDFFGAAD